MSGEVEIGHEKAQSVIDSITSSYAAEGQTMPMPGMLPGMMPGQSSFPPPVGMGFPRMLSLVPQVLEYSLMSVVHRSSSRPAASSATVRVPAASRTSRRIPPTR